MALNIQFPSIKYRCTGTIQRTTDYSKDLVLVQNNGQKAVKKGVGKSDPLRVFLAERFVTSLTGSTVIVLADIRQDLPTATTFFALRFFKHHAHALDFWQTERL